MREVTNLSLGRYSSCCYLNNLHVPLFFTPFSSDRQHLSYDGCLEVRGGRLPELYCCIVY